MTVSFFDERVIVHSKKNVGHTEPHDYRLLSVDIIDEEGWVNLNRTISLHQPMEMDGNNELHLIHRIQRFR